MMPWKRSQRKLSQQLHSTALIRYVGKGEESSILGDLAAMLNATKLLVSMKSYQYQQRRIYLRLSPAVEKCLDFAGPKVLKRRMMGLML